MTAIIDAGLLDRVIDAAWYLQIAGFPYRLYSHPTDPPAAAAGYTDVCCIESVSKGGSSLDAAAGRVRQRPATVTVDRTTYWESGPVARDLQRLRPEGARRRLLLRTTVASTGVADVEVTTTHASWPAAGTLYIDAECLSYTGKAGTGVPADPYRFTGVGRGALGTMPTSHLVDEGQALQPWVLSDVVAWRSRPATLYLRNSGATGWVEWMRGMIEASPRSTASGIELRLVPWDAMIDVELGGTHLDCGLAHGWRVMTVGHADHMTMTQIWEVGQAVNVPSGAYVPVATGAVIASTGQYGDVFDIALPVTDPRHPAIRVDQAGAPTPPTVVPTALPAADTFTTPGFPAVAPVHGPGGPPGFAESVPIRNARTALEVVATVDPAAVGTEVTKRWPLDYLSAINATWAPGTNKGAAGLWADALLIEREQRADGPSLSLKLNSTQHAGQLICRWVTDAAQAGGRSLNYPIRIAPAASPPTWVNGAIQWEHDEQLGQESGSANGRRLVDVLLAEAFYQRGEPAVTITAAPTAVGVEAWWAVTWDELGEERSATFRGKITGAVTAGGQTVGYRLEVTSPARDTPTFGDWPGYRRARLRPACVWRRGDARRILVEILTSVEGAGTNGAYDVQPYGLGVPVGAVDTAQILSYPVPPALLRWNVTIAEPRKAADLVQAMMIAWGTALQPHLDSQTGLRRVRLASVSRANVVESVASLATGDWTVDPEETEVDDKVVNAWNIKIRDKRGADDVARWVDRSSAQAHGETRAGELDLREVDLPQADEAASAAAALRSVYGELRAAHAWPRKVASGAVYQGSLIHVDAADVVTVSADEVVGYDGAEGVAGVPLRLSEIEHDPEAGSSRIEGVLDALNGTGWAPSLYVEALISPVRVRVAANRYSDTTDPVGATRRDLDFWTVGQQAMPVPAAGWAGVARTVVVLDTVTREVEFNAAHGLGVGDAIDPVDYDAAPAAQQLYAFLADANRTLGAAGDDARTYS